MLNRLKKLTTEQETLSKKIVDTQKRAREIYEIKKNTHIKVLILNIYILIIIIIIIIISHFINRKVQN